MKLRKLKLIFILINLMLLSVFGFGTANCNNGSGSSASGPFADCGRINMDAEYMYIPYNTSESGKGPDICRPAKGYDRQISEDIEIGQKVNMIASNCQSESNIVFLSECRLFETSEEVFPLITAEGFFLISAIPNFYFPDGCYVDKLTRVGFFRLNCNGSFQYLNSGDIEKKIIEWEVNIDIRGGGEPLMFIPSNLTPLFRKISLCHELSRSDSDRFSELQKGFKRLKCDEYLGVIDVFESDLHRIYDTLNFADQSGEMVRVIQKGDQISSDYNCFVSEISIFGPDENPDEFNYIHVKCTENGNQSLQPYEAYYLNNEGIEAALEGRPINEMKLYYK